MEEFLIALLWFLVASFVLVGGTTVFVFRKELWPKPGTPTKGE